MSGHGYEPGRAAERHERREETGDQSLKELVHCVDSRKAGRPAARQKPLLFC